MTTLHLRLKTVIEAHTNPSKRLKELEELTEIPAATWKTYLTRGLRPSAEMIEAVARAWPDYAYWLACGDTEPERGNFAPGNVKCDYLCRGKPMEWLTKERIYKQCFLKNAPELLEAENSEETILEAREVPEEGRAYLWLEKILRGQGETFRADLGILESDEQLQEIRVNSAKECMEFFNNTTVRRKNYATFRATSPRLAAVFNLLAKITK